MLLAIDIGNTHIVLGVFAGERIVADWRMATAGHRTADESWLTIENFCRNSGIQVEEIHRVAISSVVPDITGVFATIARRYLRQDPLIVSSELDLGIQVLYNDPGAVGADRLCNAVAGFKKYGGPLVVIDFGTATTFDVISAGGDYLGGVICLGVESCAAELHRRAAKLPKIDLAFPANVIGRDTVTSMQAGVMLGTVDAAEGIIRRIRKELGVDARVIATGGFSAIMAGRIPAIDACEPTLVLDGIRLITERVPGIPR